MNRRTIPIRCDRKSNERRGRGEVGSTEDLGDIETWLMPALIPLGSSPVGRVPGRPGRPARTYTHRPRTRIYMLFRQDIQHAICMRIFGGCKMGRCGSAARQKTSPVRHDGNHSTTIINSQTDCKCTRLTGLCTCVSLERRLAPRLVTIPTIDHHAQRRTTILTHSSSTATLKHPVHCTRVLLTCGRRCSRRRKKRKNTLGPLL